MTEHQLLSLHTDVATLKADMSSVKKDVSELRVDVKKIGDGLTEERIKLARFAVILMGGLYLISKALDPLIARLIG